MTLEQKLKEIQEIKDDGVYELIQALRKAIKQRDYYIGCITANMFSEFSDVSNKELLEILEGKDES